MKRHPLTFVDLFCGAGGLSSGLLEAGFSCKLAIDSDSAAVKTYAANLGEHAIERVLDEDVALPTATIIVGGPPCQGFSSAGLRRKGDNRNTLVGLFARLVARMKPTAFVFENVEGFLTAEHGARVRELVEPLVNAGYLIQLRKINVANYGVPQHRKRVIAIGGLGWEPTFPSPTHSAHGAPGAHRRGSGLPLAPSVADALRGLPSAVTSGLSDPTDHVYRPLDGTDLKRVKALKPGQTMRDIPRELWHDSYQRRAYRRVMDGTPTERRGGAPAGLRRLSPQEPSKAITSGARTEFVHPFEDRLLTLRECARIQTFGDEFEFEGSLATKAVLIGNAIPPQFGRVLGESLKRDLESARPRSGVSGRLLSFEPTAADGMSPALERTRRMVFRRFDVVTAPKLPIEWP